MKKIFAVGCSHALAADPLAVRAVLSFRESFKPDTVIHLGDAVDVTALRSGARGTADEAAQLEPDEDIQLALDKRRVDVVPKGWKTSEQLAKETGHTTSTVRKILIQARKAGLIEEKKFRIKCGKVIYPIKHCRKKDSSPLASRRASRSASPRAS